MFSYFYTKKLIEKFIRNFSIMNSFEIHKEYIRISRRSGFARSNRLWEHCSFEDNAWGGARRRRWGVVLGPGTPLPMGAGLRVDEPGEGGVKPTR
jgi:hypothetical protein